MDYKIKSLQLHAEKRGKFEITPIADIETKDDLSIVYTPGVARNYHE